MKNRPYIQHLIALQTLFSLCAKTGTVAEYHKTHDKGLVRNCFCGLSV